MFEVCDTIAVGALSAGRTQPCASQIILQSRAVSHLEITRNHLGEYTNFPNTQVNEQLKLSEYYDLNFENPKRQSLGVGDRTAGTWSAPALELSNRAA